MGAYRHTLLEVKQVELFLGEEELDIVPEGFLHLFFTPLLHGPYISSQLHLQEYRLY